MARKNVFFKLLTKFCYGFVSFYRGWQQCTRGSSCSRSARAQRRYATRRGYAPLESTVFSIVTPTRANSEGKLQGSKISKYISDQFSRYFSQFWAALFFFSIFLPNLFLTQLVKSVQSPVSSRLLEHLRQSLRKSPSPVQALDQWEASIYHSRIHSTNRYRSKTRGGDQNPYF